MKRTIVIILLACILSGFIGWTIGNLDQAAYEIQIAAVTEERDWFEKAWLADSSPQTQYYTEPMTNKEIMATLAETFIDGIDTANITVQFDNSGYFKGYINIYYNRPVDSTLSLELPPEFEYEQEHEYVLESK